MRRVGWTTAVLVAGVLAGGATLAGATHPTPETWVFVARGDNPVDALGAAPLAGRLDAPVVLTEQTQLTEDARDALLAADPDNVVLAGGEGALAPEVQAAIQSLLPDAEVTRIAGSSRYDTSEQLAALFDALPPSFLGAAGTANRAELADRAITADSATTADTATTATTADTATTANRADVADDADAFGGFAPDGYQFSVGRSEDSLLTLTYETEGPVYDLIDPLTFTAPTSGVIEVFAQALELAGSLEATSIHVLLDHTGPDDALSILEATVAIADATQFEDLSGMIGVDAGEHTLRLVALNDAEDRTGHNDSFAFRRLGVSFDSQGTWEFGDPFVLPAGR